MGARYLALIDHMKLYGQVTARDAKELYGLCPSSFRGMIRDIGQIVQIESIEIDEEKSGRKLRAHRFKNDGSQQCK